MILIVAVAAAVLIGLLRGGRLSALADLRIAHGWLALVAVALQFPLVYNRVGGTTIFGVPLAILMMVVSLLLTLYVIWANRHLPGMVLAGLGLLLNGLVMALNGGWMPMTPDALAWLGHMSRVSPMGGVPKVRGAKNVMLPQGETRLWWLSDIFVINFPLPAAFSIGDVLIALGLFWLLQTTLVGHKSKGEAPA